MSDRRRNVFILLAVLGLLAASAVVVATKETKLGLDLQGGVQLVYEAKPTKQVPNITPQALDRSLDILRERVDQFGVAEPEVLRAGENQLEVNLPGVDDPQRVADQVGTTASMQFYDWEPNILDEDCKTNPDQVNGGQTAISGLYNAVKRASTCPADVDANNTTSGPQFYAFDKTSKEPLLNGLPGESRADVMDSLTPEEAANAEILEVPEGVIVVRDQPATNADPDAPKPDLWWVLQDEPVLSGTDIKDPKQEFDDRRGNQPIVSMNFSDSGAEQFEETTRQIAQRGADNAFPGANPNDASHHFAIRLDNELVSVPFINYRELPDGIDAGDGATISGGFTIQSAQDLAKLLEIGALPVNLELISRSQVSATLGQQALDQGLVAALGGFIVVALFLIIFYRVLGVIATIALAIYGLYFFALVKLIPITLTLPGIAGLVLTLGVAADANIVIFERVKEEIRAGRSIGVAISTGYKKGFSTIVDANVVTLLVAFILFILATAGVKGFAFMLGIGVIVSVFTAVLATQAILLSMRGSRLLRSKAALGAGSTRVRWHFDFMGASKWFFSASGVILLIGALAIAGKGINFGIDFESGTRVTAALNESASVDDVRDALPGAFSDAKIQTIENPELGQNVVQISTEEAGGETTNQITEALDDEFGLAQEPDVEEIGPTFGQSVAESAIIAIIASLIVISVYISLRFEWKFAVPVLIALMHDLLITGGVYALTGREVTTSTVAALLTILGFSLYDTIIVFDRIRENVPRMPNATFSQIVNRSMSEVLTRSLATSFCTILPVLSLWLFGGETLQDFAFALIVGTASGTYSSVFIAAPVLTHWKEREAVYRSRVRRFKSELGYVPAFAVATAGAPVDVEPARAGRPGRADTAPADPTQVSREEFDDMVRNLGLEQEPPAATAAPGSARPAGGRRARAKGGDGAPPPPAEPGAGGGPAEEPKDKRPRNRRHGRPR